ncbi:MAG: flagellar M-ring protein FliF [Deltaproteobacteria bacterium]|nr:flagellar M-ring protein FliF [Deltaproteobacteria bacterium]
MAPKIIEQSTQLLQTVSKGRLLALIAILVVATIGFGTLIFWNTRPDFQVLFSNLSSEDAGDIVSKLKEKKIPYELSYGGTAVQVPREQVYDLRLAMATEGLPKGGGVGFEVFDRNNLGTTDFVQKLNYQRALQGELTRTVKQFKEIEQARVHIVTPKDSLFVEEQKKPTASVLVKTRSGMTLGAPQVESIVHLVASAVEGLEPNNVTVVDQAGKMLSRKNDSSAIGQLTTTQLDYQRTIEEGLKKKIQGMLEGVVGPDKAIARVSADIDFQQVQITEERFDPSAVVRSEQKSIEKSSSSSGAKMGEDREGFVSLRLPADSKTPARPNTAAKTKSLSEGPTGGTLNTSERQSEIKNYEITKINKQIRGPAGLVKKISTAIIIDGTYKEVAGAKGAKTKQYVPRTAEEIKNFENIVKKAIGFDESRGDQVEVTSMPLAWSALDEMPRAESGGAWKEMFSMLAKPVVSLVLALLFIFFIVKPLLKKNLLGGFHTAGAYRLEGPGARTALEAPGAGGEIPPLGLPGATPALPGPNKIADRSQIAQAVGQDPNRAADIVKSWLHEKG